MNSGLDHVGQQVQPEPLKSTTFQNGRLTSPKRFAHGNSPRRQGSGGGTSVRQMRMEWKCGGESRAFAGPHLLDRDTGPLWSGYCHGTYRIGPSPLLALRGAFPKHDLPEPCLSMPASDSRRAPRVSPFLTGCGNNDAAERGNGEKRGAILRQVIGPKEAAAENHPPPPALSNRWVAVTLPAAQGWRSPAF